MDAKTFHSLPAAEVARLVRAAGPKVCVFPINGTRRWFMLEHPLAHERDFETAYLAAMIGCYVRLYRLLFEHGLDTVLAPTFGPDLMARGDSYARMAAMGWVRMVNHPDFINFYETYQVRIRFYGDYHKFFKSTPYAHLLDLFDDLSAQTAAHDRHRLFFGLFAHDAAETIAELAVHYYAEHGCIPDKRTLVELYYGEHVEPVDFFIGFDKFSAFDMPLVATGFEDLYFTVCPSPYLSERQLRDILYDHLYARREQEPDYATMDADSRNWMRVFYHANQENTQGIGTNHNGIWYPRPQVKLPTSLQSPSETE